MFTKNWKAYVYVYKVRIQKSLAYRFDVYGNIIWQCIVMLSTAYFWRALYKGYDLVKGVREERYAGIHGDIFGNVLAVSDKCRVASDQQCAQGDNCDRYVEAGRSVRNIFFRRFGLYHIGVISECAPGVVDRQSADCGSKAGQCGSIFVVYRMCGDFVPD